MGELGTEQGDLASALERKALLEREIASYRVTETSGPRERLDRVEELRRDLLQSYLPVVWLVAAGGLFLLEVFLDAPLGHVRLNLPGAFYTSLALAGSVHLAFVLVRLHRRVGGRAPR